MKATSISLLSLLLILVCACNEEEEYAVKTKAIQVSVRDSMALSVSPSNSGWVYTSANKNIATVSASGVVTGNYAGTTTITVSNAIGGISDQVPVTVLAKNNLFRDPYPTFFVDEFVVRAYETRTLASSGYLTSGISYLLYEPDNLYHEGILYLFSDSLKYFEAEVLVNKWYDDKLYAHLNDRYMLKSQSTNSYKYYLSPDSSTIVYIDSYSDEKYMAIYLSREHSNLYYMLSWNLF